MLSHRSASLAVVDRGNAPRSSMPTQGLRLPQMPRGAEKERHNLAHSAAGIDSSEKLGRYRWAVERTLSWINRFRRLKVRYERRDDIHQAFLDLGCALICWRYVQRLC
jgi:Transposase DDE domain